MNEAKAKKLVGDFAVAVAYRGDAARIEIGNKIVDALVGTPHVPAAQAALDALQVAIDAWGQTESPPGAIEAARERLRTELGLPSVGQVVNEIQAERLSIERACGLGDRIAPCPFCGSENVELICSGSAWFVECRECQATGPMLVDGEDRDSIRAVELWAIPPRTRHPLSGKSESIANQTKDVPPL